MLPPQNLISLPYLNKSSHFSSIILSRYPLKKDKAINHYAVVGKVLLDETEFTVIGIHLLAPFNQQLLDLFAYLYFKYNKVDKLPLPLRGNFEVALEQMEYLKTSIDHSNQNLILMCQLQLLLQ